MRYAISGNNTTAVTQCSSATGVVRGLMGTSYSVVTVGRAFWLRGFWMMPHGTDAYVTLYDATEGSVASASLRRITVFPPTAAAYLNSGFYEFPAPGLKFTTGVGVLIGPTMSGLATFLIGGVGGCGYEEA